MANFDRFIEPRRRGLILAVLLKANIEGCSLPLLASIVRQAGYPADEETLAIDAAFLAKNGLLSQRKVGPLLFVAIEQRGRDVATGNLLLPGIERPADGEV